MRRGWRILILLFVFVLVAGLTFSERLWVRGWARPLDVVIYPIAMDAASTAFVAQLTADDFQEIAAFLAAEAPRWRRKALPAPHVVLSPPIRDVPPLVQAHNGLEAMAASLRLRWYAFRHTPFWGSLGKVRLFVLYHELQFDRSLPHSLGLQKGLLGVVHVFASDQQRAQNAVVITHELLHTLGATDKYDANGQPLYPSGFAEPYADPRFPQSKAEIMAGRVPISEIKAEIPKGLAQAAVGYATASEIGW
jgi:hypothetical protein